MILNHIIIISSSSGGIIVVVLFNLGRLACSESNQ